MSLGKLDFIDYKNLMPKLYLMDTNFWKRKYFSKQLTGLSISPLFLYKNGVIIAKINNINFSITSSEEHICLHGFGFTRNTGRNLWPKCNFYFHSVF